MSSGPRNSTSWAAGLRDTVSHDRSHRAAELLLQEPHMLQVLSFFYNTVQAVNKTFSTNYFISEHLVLLEDGTLVITSATLNTTGIYTCIAENSKGNDQRHFLVEVLGKYRAP